MPWRNFFIFLMNRLLVSNATFLVPMAFRESMTGVSSAALSMSSSTACNGKMLRASMDHTKLSTIVLSAGADWGSLTGFLRSLLSKTAPQHAWWLMPHISRHTGQQQVCWKKGPFPMYRTHKRRPEFKTPRCLQCLRSTVGLPSVRRSGERLQRRCCPAWYSAAGQGASGG